MRRSKHRPKSTAPAPKDLLPLERSLHARGLRRIAGVDEAGRGCLAGPVFAAAVILPPGLILPEVDDSKKLPPPERDRLFEEIRRHAVAWSVASVDAEEIDRINIHHASLKAMKLAVSSMAAEPEYLLIDGKFTLSDAFFFLPQEAVVDGDALCQSIAAASILAKVSRDRWISEEGRKYPEYNFGRHKGYGTVEHREAIRRYGPTPLHRRSFRWES
ncbi:MAG TPA: ribonuclease HII [bacterium]|nr:ribonuclease HII [bacterium]